MTTPTVTRADIEADITAARRRQKVAIRVWDMRQAFIQQRIIDAGLDLLCASPSQS